MDLLLNLACPIVAALAYLSIGVWFDRWVSNGHPASDGYEDIFHVILWPLYVAVVLAIIPFCLIWDGGMWLWDNLKPKGRYSE